MKESVYQGAVLVTMSRAGALGGDERAGWGAGRGGSWQVSAALGRCLDFILKTVRELLKNLKQEWNLCPFVI